MMYTHVNNADTTAVGSSGSGSQARGVGGTSLAVAAGSAFGTPSPTSPLRVSVNRTVAGVVQPITILKCVGRSGNTLSIDGTADGYADAQVMDGDQVVAAWTAGAVGDLVAALDAKADVSNAVTLAGAQTITGQKTLTTPRFKGASFVNSVDAEASGFDAAGHGFPAPIRFKLARGVDLAAGTGLVGALVPFDGKIAKVLVAADVNGASGGFSIQINHNGTAIFAAPVAVAASDTSAKTFSTFAADAVSAGGKITIDASGVGAGVQGVEVLVIPLTGNR